MARRSAPPSSGPSYVPHPSTFPQRRSALQGSSDEEPSLFSRFIQSQILAPEKLPGNISILTGVGMFVGGILAARTWGELMVPA